MKLQVESSSLEFAALVDAVALVEPAFDKLAVVPAFAGTTAVVEQISADTTTLKTFVVAAAADFAVVDC